MLKLTKPERTFFWQAALCMLLWLAIVVAASHKALYAVLVTGAALLVGITWMSIKYRKPRTDGFPALTDSELNAEMECLCVEGMTLPGEPAAEPIPTDEQGLAILWNASA